MYYILYRNKKTHTDKPSYSAIFETIRNLKKIALINVNYKTAIPALGADSQDLEWSALTNYLFKNSETQILTYLFIITTTQY